MQLRPIAALILAMTLILSACSAKNSASGSLSSRPGTQIQATNDNKPQGQSPAISPSKLSGTGTGTVVSPYQKGQLPPAPTDMAFAEGVKLPAFRLADLSGKNYSGDIFSGQRLTVLNFWGTY